MPKARSAKASGSAVCDVRAGSNPGDVSKRGWDLASNGDLLGGLACHEAATALPNAGALNWFHRARTEQEAGMHRRAMSSYERAVNAVETRLRSTEALESYFQLGKLRRDHGEFSAAERTYREVLKLGPDRSGAHIMLGVTLRDAERLDESVHHYSVGLTLHPGIPAAQYNRAQIYSQLSREEEAIHGYRVAVSAEPTFALAQEMLGEALGARGRLAEAVSALGHG
jgi:protein O-GlcNAc transferase